jgi:hypothetical protein
MPVVALASAALLASVCCRQTRDAVLALYVVGGAGALAVWLAGGALRHFDPLYVLAPAWGPEQARDPAAFGERWLISSLLWGCLAGVCLAVGIWRLRPVYVRELESVRPNKLSWYSAERVPVSDEPVNWRERHVEGLAPNPTLRRIPQWLGITLVTCLTALSSLTLLGLSMAPGSTTTDLVRAVLNLNVRKAALLLPDATLGFQLQGVLVMLLFSLVVGIRCSGAVTGERERQTWEALLLTPLSARQVIRGKLWGVMASSYCYLLAYAGPAVTLSILGGLLALFWTVLWLAVTVLAMYFVGAAGLWCSVQAKNSWRALLATLGVGYVGGALIYVVTSPAIWVLSLLLLLLLFFIDLSVGTSLAALCFNNLGTYFQLFFISSGIGLAVAFWLAARVFLNRAQRWVADRERTRHWYDEPLSSRPRRRAEVSSVSRES